MDYLSQGVAQALALLLHMDAATLSAVTATLVSTAYAMTAAMLLGLPCVASAVGGIPSMLANGTEGLLYGDALDADALARAVLQVLHSPDGGTAMGRAARARALQTHDAARNAADLLHIYESILQEEHP